MRIRGLLAVAAVVSIVLVASTAQADIDIKFGGQIASDIRFRLGGATIPATDTITPFPSQQRLLKNGFSRNDNLIKAQLSLGISDKVKAVADIDFYWYGYSDLNDLNADTYHERVDPYRLEATSAYVDIYRVLPHLDLRIGRQVVVWGSGDKFNPTNNLNTLDLSDPLLFGKALGNNMIRADWNPWGDIVVTAVWVPIFRPAQIPRTAPVALTEPFRPAPVQEDAFRKALAIDAALQTPSLIRANALQPDPSIENSQVGVRVAGRFGGIDTSLSYYHGRWGIATPAWAVNRKDGTVDATVMWPRMDVLGGDIAGSLEKLGGLGYWVEGAVFFPQKITYGVYDERNFDHADVTFTYNADGSAHELHDAPGGKRATVIPSQPFLKLTAGLDFSWTKWLYSNLQYVYGFIDEFGAGKQCFALAGAVPGDNPRCESRIGHYLVVGSDIKLFNDQLLLRLFGAFKIPQQGDQDPKFTAVLFPQVAWAVWDATELTVGAFVFLGDRDTKFGDPAAGATEIFMKARFTY